jgi:hypothetical protein
MSDVEAAEAVAGSGGSKQLLSKLGGGLSAGGSALPKPKTSHPYIVGLSLILVGGFMLIGSITGTLPSMLAALFDPDALEDASHNSPVANVLHDITNVVIDPLSAF